MKKFFLALSLSVVTAITCMCFAACEKVIAAESITLSETSVTLDSNKTKPLICTTQPENATVKIEISDETVVKYENDELTALTTGKATVKVYSAADSTVFAECTVNVSAPVGYNTYVGTGCKFVYPSSWKKYTAEGTIVAYIDGVTNANVNLTSEDKNNSYFSAKADTFKKTISDEYKKMGLSVTFSECTVGRSDHLGYKRVHVVYDYRIGTYSTVHQEQMILNSGSKTYILTLTNVSDARAETMFSEFVGRVAS